MTERVPFRAIDGVLLLNKPVGPTSNHALQQARRLFRAKKAGHTGTLDPLASGLLPICFGEATKFSGYGLDADKTYLATIRLGIMTETGDKEGAIVEEKPVGDIKESVLLQVLSSFEGDIDQVPPMYSALKHQGKPLYQYAQAGKTIERKARNITIHRIECIGVELPFITIRVTCSKGTYIRTLAEDIGNALACGGHLTALCREGMGQWALEDAVDFETLSVASDLDRFLRSPDELVSKFPICLLSPEETQQLYFGQKVLSTECLVAGCYRLYRKQSTPHFIGLGRYNEDKTLQSVRLLKDLPQ